MAKLSDKQRKEIIAKYSLGSSQTALAKKYKVSSTTIRRVLQSDPKMSEKVAQKKEKNAISVLAHMDMMKNDVCDLIDAIVEEMSNHDKIKVTPLNLLALTMGILIDKFTANESKKPNVSAPNNLFDAINNCAKGEYDDIPELQQAAEDDADMVEQPEIRGI